MDITNLVAIDVHTHVHVSQRTAAVHASQEVQDAAKRYFKHEEGASTLPEIAAYYRERKMACVVFPVDAESTTGQVRFPNEELEEVAAEYADVLIPFASIDPAKGKMGAREVQRLIEQFGK